MIKILRNKNLVGGLTIAFGIILIAIAIPAIMTYAIPLAKAAKDSSSDAMTNAMKELSLFNQGIDDVKTSMILAMVSIAIGVITIIWGIVLLTVKKLQFKSVITLSAGYGVLAISIVALAPAGIAFAKGNSEEVKALDGFQDVNDYYQDNYTKSANNMAGTVYAVAAMVTEQVMGQPSPHSWALNRYAGVSGNKSDGFTFKFNAHPKGVSDAELLKNITLGLKYTFTLNGENIVIDTPEKMFPYPKSDWVDENKEFKDIHPNGDYVMNQFKTKINDKDSAKVKAIKVINNAFYEQMTFIWNIIHLDLQELSNFNIIQTALNFIEERLTHDKIVLKGKDFDAPGNPITMLLIRQKGYTPWKPVFPLLKKFSSLLFKTVLGKPNVEDITLSAMDEVYTVEGDTFPYLRNEDIAKFSREDYASYITKGTDGFALFNFQDADGVTVSDKKIILDTKGNPIFTDGYKTDGSGQQAIFVPDGKNRLTELQNYIKPEGGAYTTNFVNGVLEYGGWYYGVAPSHPDGTRSHAEQLADILHNRHAEIQHLNLADRLNKLIKDQGGSDKDVETFGKVFTAPQKSLLHKLDSYKKEFGNEAAAEGLYLYFARIAELTQVDFEPGTAGVDGYFNNAGRIDSISLLNESLAPTGAIHKYIQSIIKGTKIESKINDLYKLFAKTNATKVSADQTVKTFYGFNENSKSLALDGPTRYQRVYNVFK